jgi:hypothetical protein
MWLVTSGSGAGIGGGIPYLQAPIHVDPRSAGTAFFAAEAIPTELKVSSSLAETTTIQEVR